jgi:hypothetical protein
MMSRKIIRSAQTRRQVFARDRRQSPGDTRQQTRLNYSLTFTDYMLICLLWLITMALRYFLVILVTVSTVSLAVAQPAARRSVFMPGETLQYKVKWGFFRLGTVVITQQPCDSRKAEPRLLSMSVHSASGLPFISVHFLNSSFKSPNALWVSEETIITGEDSSDRTTYWQDTAAKMLYRTRTTKGCDNFSFDSSHVDGLSYDALGLLMMARLYAATNQTIALPTLNEFAVKETEITFTNEMEELDVAACDTPVRCRRIEGNAKWVGNSFAGMKGPFTGWISDDDASLPLRAELKIFLGSIVLELESTNRLDWGPRKLVSNQVSGK